MNVALLTEFSASRKDPLSAVLERIHSAFAAAGLDEPVVQFTFADAPVDGFTSSVDRVIKRHAHLERFVSTAPSMPGGPAVKMISNGTTSPAAGEALAFWTLLGIASGVPRSFPFHSVVIHFQSPAFGAGQIGHPVFAMPPGIVVTDSWWVNGRARSVRAITSVVAGAEAKELPSPSPQVAEVLAACGRAKKTVQIPVAGGAPSSDVPRAAVASQDARQAVNAIVVDYRTRLSEIVTRASLPHDLPPAPDVLKAGEVGGATGPKKPVLQRAFSTMGYDCRADSGTFTLRRRTAGNLSAEIYLDVGTWSRSVTAFFTVHGVGFTARLPLPVSQRAIGAGQYPIGDSAQWQKIVGNLAALVIELDRSFVPAIEAAGGRAPDWFRPES